MFPTTAANPISGAISSQSISNTTAAQLQGLSPVMNFSSEIVELSDGTVIEPNQFAMSDGKVLFFDGDLKLKNWIEKIIRTAKGRFEIYSRVV